MALTIETNNRSGTFSARSSYATLGDQVTVADWSFDAYGILPSGTEYRTLSPSEAKAEIAQRKAAGWK